MWIRDTGVTLLHSQVARLLDGARLKLRKLKTRSTLLGASTSCHLLISNLEATTVDCTS
jgi:hypothetical protein